MNQVDIPISFCINIRLVRLHFCHATEYLDKFSQLALPETNYSFDSVWSWQAQIVNVSLAAILQTDINVLGIISRLVSVGTTASKSHYWIHIHTFKTCFPDFFDFRTLVVQVSKKTLNQNENPQINKTETQTLRKYIPQNVRSQSITIKKTNIKTFWLINTSTMLESWHHWKWNAHSTESKSTQGVKY